MRRIIARLSKKSQRASEMVSKQAHDFQGGIASRRVNLQSSPDRLTVDNPDEFYTAEDRQNETVVRGYDVFIGGLFDMAGLDDEFQRDSYHREVIVRKPTDSQRKERMHSSREAFEDYHRKLRWQ